MGAAGKVAAMTQAILAWPEADFPLDLSVWPDLTDEDLFRLCSTNELLRFERLATGEVIIMPPAFGISGHRNLHVAAQIQAWSVADGTGVAFDASAGFRLASTAVFAPDVAWVRRDRLMALDESRRKGFVYLCPDFVVELRSETDRLPALQRKMAHYVENGLRLGWLLDPRERVAWVYRPGVAPEQHEAPDSLSGEPELPGLRVDLRALWEQPW
jgi:Uma2 family endonuclease